MLDINAMRNKDDNSQPSQLKDKSFDEAIREFVASCSRWYYTPYNELHHDFERWYHDKGDILAFVLYTGLLELIVGILEELYDYSYEDKTIFNEEGFPIGLFKETYINYCLYKYIHAKTTTESEYYKMRAEQGFGCTLEEELARRNSEDPSFEIVGAAYSTGTVAEQLYENTKLWGVDPDSQYSFVTYWRTSVDMPEDLVKDLIMFMTEFRDYIDIADICTMCADFMHTAYTLVTKYDIFADITIDNIHKILMMALLFRCYLDQQRQLESWSQQNQMREENYLLW